MTHEQAALLCVATFTGGLAFGVTGFAYAVVASLFPNWPRASWPGAAGRALVLLAQARHLQNVMSAPGHPLAGRAASAKRLAGATWILREEGSGTREAADRWLVTHLRRIDIELELGSNEAVKQAVASGLGLGCLSRHAVAEALRQGWLVELHTPLPAIRRTLALVVHKRKRLGAAAQDFVRHCLASAGDGAKGSLKARAGAASPTRAGQLDQVGRDNSCT